MVGGTGWVSTIEYYRLINKEINSRLHGFNNARCILYSLNYSDIQELNLKNDITGIFNLVMNAVKLLENAGADCILLCANTMHMFATEIEKNISIPLINIVRAVSNEIKMKNLTKVGLLGTKPTMEMDFYKSFLNNENIDVIIPDSGDREFIQLKIANELVKDIFDANTKKVFLEIIQKLKNRGAEGIILGCTEIPLLIKQEDVDIPVIDTLKYHSLAAVEFALSR